MRKLDVLDERPFLMEWSMMYRIIQAPALIAMLFESDTGRYRQIHMDGTDHRIIEWSSPAQSKVRISSDIFM
jgi:hypothetical protein